MEDTRNHFPGITTGAQIRSRRIIKGLKDGAQIII